jgi:hypothetical protein
MTESVGWPIMSVAASETCWLRKWGKTKDKGDAGYVSEEYIGR